MSKYRSKQNENFRTVTLLECLCRQGTYPCEDSISALHRTIGLPDLALSANRPFKERMLQWSCQILDSVFKCNPASGFVRS